MEERNQLYKESYFILFSCISRALEAMEELDFGRARSLLKEGQANAEEAYLAATDPIEEE